MLALETGLHV